MQSDVAEYLRELVSRVAMILGDALVGVYAGGSLALGDYCAGRSDLDVVVVSEGPLASEKKQAIADALRHEALQCPARGLELVVYTEQTVRGGTCEAGYQLNLNSGRGMPFVCSFAPEGETHWYALDREVVRAHGLSLVGPPPVDLFAPTPRDPLLERMVESVQWYAENPWAGADNAVLNACRAWRWAAEGVWSSKTGAGAWAITRAEDRELVEDALAARVGDRPPLDARRVRLFVDGVRRQLEDEGRADAGSLRS